MSSPEQIRWIVESNTRLRWERVDAPLNTDYEAEDTLATLAQRLDVLLAERQDAATAQAFAIALTGLVLAQQLRMLREELRGDA